MSDAFPPPEVVGGVAGFVVAGVPGAMAGHELGGLLADAYANKPEAGSFAATLQNDLAPENVTLDAHQIYVRITGGKGSATLAVAGTVATLLAERFGERSGQIARARAEAAAAWQGDAAEAADAATTPLADSFAVARRQLAANAKALEAEVAAFDHIRSQVEFVPATPPQSGFGNDINPFQTDTDAAINEYNAKAAKNVALYEAYSAQTAAARSEVPRAYAQPDPLSASAAAVASVVSPVGAASVAPPPVGPAGADRPAATNASGAPGGDPATPPNPGGTAGQGAGGGTPGGTAGQGAGPSGATGRQTPSGTTPSGTTPSAAPGGVPVLPPARNAVTGGPVAGRRRPGTSGAPRSLPSGPGTGGIGAFGGGAGGISTGGIGAGPGSGGGTGMRGGPSVGTGPAPGQAPPGQQAGRGGAGGAALRGAPGASGLPMAPGARSDGEDDQEHRRKYLIEPDKDELFGPDERYVPPVIGDYR